MVRVLGAAADTVDFIASFQEEERAVLVRRRDHACPRLAQLDVSMVSRQGIVRLNSLYPSQFTP